MTDPTSYRVFASHRIPLPLVPRIIAAMSARYPEETAGVTDPDAIFRAALRAWVVETLVAGEEKAAMSSLDVTVAKTIASFEENARKVKEKALADAQSIVPDIPDDAAN